MFGSNTVKHRNFTDISRTLVANIIVGHSDVVGASPVGADPTTSSLFTSHMASIGCATTALRRREKTLKFFDLVRRILEIWRYV